MEDLWVRVHRGATFYLLENVDSKVWGYSFRPRLQIECMDWCHMDWCHMDWYKLMDVKYRLGNRRSLGNFLEIDDCKVFVHYAELVWRYFKKCSGNLKVEQGYLTWWFICFSLSFLLAWLVIFSPSLIFLKVICKSLLNWFSNQ